MMAYSVKDEQSIDKAQKKQIMQNLLKVYKQEQDINAIILDEELSAMIYKYLLNEDQY